MLGIIPQSGNLNSGKVTLTRFILIAGILDAIRALMHSPEPAKKRRIGFVQND